MNMIRTLWHLSHQYSQLGIVLALAILYYGRGYLRKHVLAPIDEIIGDIARLKKAVTELRTRAKIQAEQFATLAVPPEAKPADGAATGSSPPPLPAAKDAKNSSAPALKAPEPMDFASLDASEGPTTLPKPQSSGALAWFKGLPLMWKVGIIALVVGLGWNYRGKFTSGSSEDPTADLAKDAKKDKADESKTEATSASKPVVTKAVDCAKCAVTTVGTLHMEGAVQVKDAVGNGDGCSACRPANCAGLDSDCNRCEAK